jgi:hypothetical protein
MALFLCTRHLRSWEENADQAIYWEPLNTAPFGGWQFLLHMNTPARSCTNTCAEHHNTYTGAVP